MSLQTMIRAVLGISTILVVLAISPPRPVAAKDDSVLAVLEAFHQDGQFDGAAVVYRDGKQIVRQGFGQANIEKGIANTPEGRFDIASITKAFTATITLQLVEEDKWALDSQVGKILPEIERAEVAAITLQQLLEHRSGIGRDHTEFYPSSRQDLGFTDLVDVLNNSELLFEPGTRSSYSNSGYVLLRYALERISGKTYEDLLREKILRPLGMQSTGVLWSPDAIPGLALGYSTWLITEPSPAQPRDGAKGDMLGAGGLYSTVDDLWLFVQGIEDRKILDDERVALLWPAQDPGLAWEILELPAADGKTTGVILTTGASPLGYLSAVAWIPGSKSGYVVLTNSEAPGRAGFPSLLIQMESALHGATRPVEVPETPIRDVLQALFDKDIDTALAVYQALEKPADSRARADAAQAAGAPDAPPGETPRAWASLTPNDRPEWLELWYDPPVDATEIHVYETQVPGSITSVGLRSATTRQQRFEIRNVTRDISDQGVPISVIPLPANSTIEFLTLHLDAAGVPGWTQIDAVGLRDSGGQVQWATGARASSSAADGVPPPLHAYPSAHALENVARAYRRAGRVAEARYILGFLGRVKKAPAP